MRNEMHTGSLLNVRENDSVEMTTTEGDTFEATCVNKVVHSPEPEVKVVRDVRRTWYFVGTNVRPIVTVTDGRRESPDDPEFPVHKPMFERQSQRDMGYVTHLVNYSRKNRQG
jgi:hypothetical protein